MLRRKGRSADLTDEAIKDLKKIAVYGGDPERYWMVKAFMTEEKKSSLVCLFDKSSNIFAWTPHEMPRVDPEVSVTS